MNYKDFEYHKTSPYFNSVAVFLILLSDILSNPVFQYSTTFILSCSHILRLFMLITVNCIYLILWNIIILALQISESGGYTKMAPRGEEDIDMDVGGNPPSTPHSLEVTDYDATSVKLK